MTILLFTLRLGWRRDKQEIHNLSEEEETVEDSVGEKKEKTFFQERNCCL